MSHMEDICFISGDRLCLREVRPEDANESYYRWMNDEKITQFTESRFYPQSLGQIQEYVRKMDGTGTSVFFAIVDKESKKHIGNIKIGSINWIHRTADIGLIIGEKDFWGRGYATEAIQMVSQYAFQKLNLHKVWAGCYDNNIGSIKAFLKAGFVQEGVLRKHYFFQGEYINAVLLGLLNEVD